ncbi:MAG: hypothetical protein KatS3mg057_2036 [Herpetosiphonaceae bacterium]|nr:MAG: hypothetical protein KatS3mg057_2036 [Herpetosiphonaceae bacterium]
MSRRYILQSTLAVVLLGLLAGCGQRASDYNSRGNELYDQQRYGEALAEYREAARLAPERAEPFANSGNARHQLHDYLGAADEQQSALTLAEPEIQAKIYYDLGNSYYRLREWEQAIESYKQALRLNPDDGDAKYNLELAQRQLQQQQQATNQGRPDPNRPEQQDEQGGNQRQTQPGGEEQQRPNPEPPPPSMSRGEAEEQLDRLRRREQRRSDEIYRDYAVGGEGSDSEAGPDDPSGERDW